ncbi:hypothetical protein JCM11491_003712 [Sporobolomyces phaffii]
MPPTNTPFWNILWILKDCRGKTGDLKIRSEIDRFDLWVKNQFEWDKSPQADPARWCLLWQYVVPLTRQEAGILTNRGRSHAPANDFTNRPDLWLYRQLVTLYENIQTSHQVIADLAKCQTKLVRQRRLLVSTSTLLTHDPLREQYEAIVRHWRNRFAQSRRARDLGIRDDDAALLDARVVEAFDQVGTLEGKDELLRILRGMDLDVPDTEHSWDGDKRRDEVVRQEQYSAEPESSSLRTTTSTLTERSGRGIL